MKKILLLAIALVIVFSSVANFEGTWLLWEKDINMATGQGGYALIKAVPTYEQCIQLQKQKVKRLEENLKALGVKVEASSEFVTFELDGNLIAIHYQCFPETIDPRK